MDNKENTQEFSLEDIMAEFATTTPVPEDGQGPEAAEISELPPDAAGEEESLPEVPVEPEVPQPEVPEEAPEAAAEASATDSTIRLDSLDALPSQPDYAGASREEAAPADDATIRLDKLDNLAQATEEAPAAGPQPDTQEGYTLTAQQIPTPKPIPFRSHLGELKRKLVSGPEKRYYDLSEIGLGRVQIAIFVNLLIVALCAGGTALYAMGAVLENRMRLMVFSQILAMMVSALLGCYVLMDGIVDLFTGKFSLRSMLVLTLAACAADAVFCLQELRVPCCAAFSLEMTFALWDRSLRRSTEMGQMDTLRKATRLEGLVKQKDHFGSLPGILRQEGRVEDFMDHYSKRTGPEKALNIFALVSVLLCGGIALLAGLRHNLSLAVQVFSTSMLVAVPAGAFVSQSRPMAILERRLHMVGSVICGWQGVKTLCGKAAFPLTDRDLFPLGSTKLNGVKFLADQELEPEQVIAWAASLMRANGGGLEPVFTQLLKSRGGKLCPVEELVIYEQGGVGGTVAGQALLMGTPDFLKAQGVDMAGVALMDQAVYMAAQKKAIAVFAIQYSRTKASAGGLVTLGSYRKIRPLVLCSDFMITPQLIKDKFGIRTKRYQFPTREDRAALLLVQPEPELVSGALVTQPHLSSAAYTVTGARTLRGACRAGMALHIFAGVLGMLVMAALAWLGDLELLSPINVLLYQAVWLVPGILITEWTRTV